MMHPDAWAFIRMMAIAGCFFWAARFAGLLVIASGFADDLQELLK